MRRNYGYKQGCAPSLKQPFNLFIGFNGPYYKFSFGLFLWRAGLVFSLPEPSDHGTDIRGGLWVLYISFDLFWLLKISVGLPVWWTKPISRVELAKIRKERRMFGTRCSELILDDIRCGNDSMSGSISSSKTDIT